MIFDRSYPPLPLIEIHPQDCACSHCQAFAPPAPPRAPRYRDALEAVSLRMIAGLVLGVVLTWLVDAITSGPGLGVMVGL